MREKNKLTRTKVRFLKPCVRPDVGDLLPDYIVDLLSDDAAEEVEEHLLLCGNCRRDYLHILSLRETMRKTLSLSPDASSETKEGGADVRRISDYQK